MKVFLIFCRLNFVVCFFGALRINPENDWHRGKEVGLAIHTSWVHYIYMAVHVEYSCENDYLQMKKMYLFLFLLKT